MLRRTGAKVEYCSAILALLFAQPVFAAIQAPVANAGPDRTGTVNVAITFSGSGSYDPDGSIALYSWQFGDGLTASTTTASVAHTYTAGGTYSLTLWVKDNSGAWSATGDVAQVTIGSGSTPTTTTTTTPPTTIAPVGNNKLPVAKAGPDQATQTLVNVTFNGSSSSDPDGTIVAALWEFGDGTMAAGLVATHQYAAAATYTATLTVSDNRGGVNNDTARITVANRPPVANAGPDVSGAPSASIVLNGSASSDPDGSIVTHAWTFGDGTTGSGASPSHAYAAAGSYTASLTVTDNKGATSTDSALVTIANTTPPSSSTWAKSLGSTNSDAGYAIRGDAAGNTFIGGAYRGTVNFGGTTLSSAGGADGFVAKYSSTGGLLWARSLGGSSDDYVDAIAVDGSGNVLVAGRFTGSASFGGATLVANGSSDMAVAKLAGSNGAHQWSKRFGGAYDDAASAIAADSSGNVYFTGYFRGTADFGGGPLTVPYINDLDVFVAKLSSSGAHVWSKNFTNDGNERGYGIVADGTGNVAITGSFSNTVNFGGGGLTSTNAMTDMFVARFTTTGAHSWSRRVGAGDGNESGYGAAMDGSGNVIVTGTALKSVDCGGGLLSALGGTDAIVAKYTAASGAHVWSRRLGGLGNDYGYGVAVDGSNNIYVIGSFEGIAAFGGLSLTTLGSSDAFVAKYGPSGTFTWVRGLGGISGDVGRAIGMSAANPVVTGYFYGVNVLNLTTLTSAGMADAFVARIAP